jgi:hypothetical protein
MRLRSLSLLTALLCGLAIPQVLRADRLELKDGTRIEGIILKVEKGQVTVTVGQDRRVFSILDVTSMDFDTPHVPEGVSQRSVEHFAANTEAQEIVRHIQDVNQAAANARELLEQTKNEWGNGKTIAGSDTPQWEATKEQFARALSRYQEVLGDFYSHIVTRVDQYNRLTKEAGEVRVGVRGVFNAGSALVSKETQELPLKNYVPSTWYDTIFYRGYSFGYNDGYYGARPRDFVAPQ